MYSDNEDDDYTLMEDVVIYTLDDKEYYFFDPDFGGGFAWRHAKHCKVVGNV